MEGGQDGVIGRLALNRVVMVLSCPVDHVPILPLPLEELTVREITYGQGRAKKWNVLVNTIPMLVTKWIMLCLMCLKHLNDVQFFVRSTLNVYQRFLLVSWSWITEIYCYSFGNIKQFFLLVCFFVFFLGCSKFWWRFFQLMSNLFHSWWKLDRLGILGGLQCDLWWRSAKPNSDLHQSLATFWRPWLCWRKRRGAFM